MKTDGFAQNRWIQPLRRLGDAIAHASAIIALFLFASTVLISCDRPPATPAAAEPIHVVVPIYVLADVVRQVGGDRVDVQWWIEDGQSPTELQETTERVNQLRNADLVISRGLVDLWTIQGFSSEYENHRLIRLDRLPAARDSDPQHYSWLDPYMMLDLADALAERFPLRDPRNAKLYHDNAAAFRARVIQTCDEIRPKMDKARGGFLTLDRGFVPLAHRFSLNDVHVESINLTDPSPYGIKVLRETAKTAGAKAIFVNDQLPGALLRDLENRLGLTILTLDATGSSAPSSGRNTSIEVLQYNLNQIIKGMK